MERFFVSGASSDSIVPCVAHCIFCCDGSNDTSSLKGCQNKSHKSPYALSVDNDLK